MCVHVYVCVCVRRCMYVYVYMWRYVPTCIYRIYTYTMHVYIMHMYKHTCPRIYEREHTLQHIVAQGNLSPTHAHTRQSPTGGCCTRQISAAHGDLGRVYSRRGAKNGRGRESERASVCLRVHGLVNRSADPCAEGTQTDRYACLRACVSM